MRFEPQRLFFLRLKNALPKGSSKQKKGRKPYSCVLSVDSLRFYLPMAGLGEL
jgi:hypothetical protein